MLIRTSINHHPIGILITPKLLIRQKNYPTHSWPRWKEHAYRTRANFFPRHSRALLTRGIIRRNLAIFEVNKSPLTFTSDCVDRWSGKLLPFFCYASRETFSGHSEKNFSAPLLWPAAHLHSPPLPPVCNVYVCIHAAVQQRLVWSGKKLSGCFSSSSRSAWTPGIGARRRGRRRRLRDKGAGAGEKHLGKFLVPCGCPEAGFIWRGIPFSFERNEVFFKVNFPRYYAGVEGWEGGICIIFHNQIFSLKLWKYLYYCGTIWNELQNMDN